METEKFDSPKQKGRTLSDAELLSHGAEYNEKGQIIATEKQTATAEEEMRAELMAKDILQYFNLEEFRTIVVALQEEKTKLSQSSKEQDNKKAEEVSILLNRLQEAYKAAFKTQSAKNELPKSK